jgi:hypothetical protein
MSVSFLSIGERNANWQEIYGNNGPQLSPAEVGLGEWKTTKGLLNTFGLVSAVGLGAVNLDTKTGLLGHYEYPEQIDNGDFSFFHHTLQAIKTLGKPHSTRIVLAGASTFDASQKEKNLIIARRNYCQSLVEATTNSLGIADQHLETKWTDDNPSLSMRINCHIGKITVGYTDDIQDIVDID